MTEKNNKDVVLASASPRRIALLKKFIPSLKVVSPDIDEAHMEGESHTEFIKRISFEKALAVSKQISNALIIAADTVVVTDGEFLGKPADKNKAKNMLSKLLGKRHSVFTGITVFDVSSGESLTDTVCTDVYMDNLSEKELEFYVDSLEPFDKAGGYGIQDIASLFIKKINGDYFNVVGLPLFKLKKIMESFGVNLIESASLAKNESKGNQR